MPNMNKEHSGLNFKCIEKISHILRKLINCIKNLQVFFFNCAFHEKNALL